MSVGRNTTSSVTHVVNYMYKILLVRKGIKKYIQTKQILYCFRNAKFQNNSNGMDMLFFFSKLVHYYD